MAASSSSSIPTSSSGGSLPGGKVAPEAAKSVQYETRASHYKLLALIGEGSMCSSSIYSAIHSKTEKTVAVKCIELDRHKDEDDNRRLALAVCELHMTSICWHTNIIHHLTTFIHQYQVWVVMDYMDKGSVRDILDSVYYDGLPELAIACVIKQLVHALHYLHAKNIVHRSVKASHLLLSSTGNLHLTGLKYSALMERDGLPVSYINEFNGEYMEANLYWLSPQILAQHVGGYSTKSDMYSVGIVACEMANGLVPFCEMEPTKMFKEKLDGTVPKLIDKSTCPPILPNGGEQQPMQEESDLDKRHTMLQERVFSKGFHDFVAQCLSLSEHERPSASEALSVPFLKSNIKQSRECLVNALSSVQVIPRNMQLTAEADDAMEIKKLTLTSSGNNSRDISAASINSEWNFES